MGALFSVPALLATANSVATRLMAFFLSTWLLWVGVGAGLMLDRLPNGFPNLLLPFGLHLQLLPHTLGGDLAVTRAQLKTTQATLKALQAAEAAAGKRARAVEATEAANNDAAVKADTAAQTRIVVQTRTLVKEIPTYVTPAIDARYPLPWSFVWVHDAAASGSTQLPPVGTPAARAGDAPSGVTPSAAGAVIAANYADCRADAQQLISIQALWARQVATTVQPVPEGAGP
jgi:hypothetical protein